MPANQTFRTSQNLRGCGLLFGEFIQELCNIPFAAATARERASPCGDGIHIKTLPEQVLNLAPLGAAAMAHDLICRAGILRVHLYLLPIF